MPASARPPANPPTLSHRATAPHVQRALSSTRGSALQPSTSASRPTAAHLRAALSAHRATPAARGGAGSAGHVQRAVGAAQAKPAPGSWVPRHLAAALALALPSPPAGAFVLQRMEDQSGRDKSRRNVKKYATAFYVRYQGIIDRLIDEGFVVRGHASANSNAKMNQATKDDLRKLRDRVRELNGSVELTAEEDEEWGAKAEKLEKLPDVHTSHKEQMYNAYCEARLRARWAREGGEDPDAAFFKYLDTAWAKQGWPEDWRQYYIEQYEAKKVTK